ncbi:hypothetical protein FS749_005393 [Ceratobasidium sp. UAMH 11750]|nr:hypothetical protein FS749_005393 [Ceratobasidium sp. UAMH 11750]
MGSYITRMPAQYPFPRGARKALGVATNPPQQEIRRSPRCAVCLLAVSIASRVTEHTLYALYGRNLRLLRDNEKRQLGRATILNLILLVISVLQLAAVAPASLVGILIHLTSAGISLYFMEAGRQIYSQSASRRNPNHHMKDSLAGHHRMVLRLTIINTACLCLLLLIESARILG